jgi:Spy/CpxP family protein refolding chaperone
MNRKTIVLSSVVAVSLLAAGTVFAARRHGGPMHGGPMMKAHVVGFLDEALHDNPLSAQQKEALDAALDKAMGQAQARQADRKAALDQALSLFEADTLDTAALQKLQSDHMAQMSSHFLSVVNEVHDILTPAQRKELVAFVRDNAKNGGGLRGFGGW